MCQFAVTRAYARTYDGSFHPLLQNPLSSLDAPFRDGSNTACTTAKHKAHSPPTHRSFQFPSAPPPKYGPLMAKAAILVSEPGLLLSVGTITSSTSTSCYDYLCLEFHSNEYSVTLHRLTSLKYSSNTAIKISNLRLDLHSLLSEPWSTARKTNCRPVGLFVNENFDPRQWNHVTSYVSCSQWIPKYILHQLWLLKMEASM